VYALNKQAKDLGNDALVTLEAVVRLLAVILMQTPVVAVAIAAVCALLLRVTVT
jgi:hypothetical protein